MLDIGIVLDGLHYNTIVFYYPEFQEFLSNDL